MTLNTDCCRDVLLSIESKSFGEYYTFDQIKESLPPYSEEDIYYSCLKLHEAGFIELNLVGCLKHSIIPRISAINDLTYAGHEFLENIKQPSNWQKTKNCASKIGSYSLAILSEISKEILIDLVHKNL